MSEQAGDVRSGGEVAPLNPAPGRRPRMDDMPLGVAYYPEQEPENEWEQDALLMQELGLNCIRIGEFAWSRMQRADGTFSLDWVERVVDLFAAHGIRTVLCTPTATPPVWLWERYPDLRCITPDGRQGLFGGRRHYSVFHAAYRERCREIAAALAKRFAGHPSVAGWQIDNEAGSYSTLDCSPPAEQAFHRWLEGQYESVDVLNRQCGLVFWNQEVERFDQVPAPTEMMTTRSPQLVLAYNRFCLEGTADFLLSQAAAVREHGGTGFVVASAVEPVLHALYGLQADRGTSDVDAVSLHNYPELRSALRQPAMALDRFRAIAPRRPLFVLEQQLGSGHTTTGGLDPALRRFWAFETLAGGAKSVFWFHWRRFRAGCEWRHTGIVERDRRKRSVYTSVAEVVREVRRVEDVLADAEIRPHAQVLYCQDNALAWDRASEEPFWMQIQLPEGFRHRFPMWEREVLERIYVPLTRAGLTVGFVTPTQQWDTDLPLFVAGLGLCTGAMVERLTRFCETGGTLVCFPGAGDRDEHGALRDVPPPGMLAELVGAELLDVYPLGVDAGRAFDHQRGALVSSDEGQDTKTVRPVLIGEAEVPFDVRRAEVLATTSATTVGTYAGGPHAGRAAVVERRAGDGRVLYLGAVPVDAAAALRVYRLTIPGFPAETLPYRRVRLVSGDRSFMFLLNDGPRSCPLPGEVHDLVTASRVSALTGWGVALVAEEGTEAQRHTAAGGLSLAAACPCP